MRIERTPLPGLVVVHPDCFADDRGFFLETFQAERYRSVGIIDEFVQDNHSRSKKGVLRGMHFQKRKPQAQIVTVMRGRIFDAATDLRRKSPTFGRWFGMEMSDEGQRQLYIAPGFAHGFCVLSDTADLHYKVSHIYDSSDEAGFIWNDSDIGIRWPIDAPIVSSCDAAYPRLRDLAANDLPDMEGARR
jgi:dTDP-4-dehydrorhamnose 3,5-epimerase